MNLNLSGLFNRDYLIKFFNDLFKQLLGATIFCVFMFGILGLASYFILLPSDYVSFYKYNNEAMILTNNIKDKNLDCKFNNSDCQKLQSLMTSYKLGDNVNRYLYYVDDYYSKNKFYSTHK